jgi:hypothetical protein
MPTNASRRNSATNASKRVYSPIGFIALLALICLAVRAAPANSITDFGLTYSSLGNATLSFAANGGVEVSNIGLSGQDGVSVAMPANVASPVGMPTFTLDTSAQMGPLPTGGFFRVTSFGPAPPGGTAPVVATMTETQSSTDQFYTMDFSNSSNGPVTTAYYSGSKLIHSEQTGPPSLTVRKAGSDGPPPTYYNDYTWNENGPYVSSGRDSSSAFAADIFTGNGTDLPASDGIDLIDSSAPDNVTPGYSSISYTASGISSFEITGEALNLSVPEPPSAVVCLLAVVPLLAERRRFPRRFDDNRLSSIS